MERYMMLLKSYKRMNPELEKALRESASSLIVRKGQILQSPTTLNDNLYFVEKGLLHCYLVANEQQVTLRFKHEDEFVNTLQHLSRQARRPYMGIEALEDTLLWCIPGYVVETLCAKYDRFKFQYIEIIAREILSMQNAAACSSPESGSENFENLCQHFPQWLDRVPIQYLAKFTHMPEKQFRHLLQRNIKLHTMINKSHRNSKRAS